MKVTCMYAPVQVAVEKLPARHATVAADGVYPSLHVTAHVWPLETAVPAHATVPLAIVGTDDAAHASAALHT